MCLAVPAQIVSLEGDEQAVIDIGGIRKRVSVALVEDLVPGDWVIVHVGYALARLDPEAAAETLAAMAAAGLEPGALV